MKRGRKVKSICCPKCGEALDPSILGPASLMDRIEEMLAASDQAMRTQDIAALFPAYSGVSVRNALLRLKMAKRAENPEHGVWLVEKKES